MLACEDPGATTQARQAVVSRTVEPKRERVCFRAQFLISTLGPTWFPSPSYYSYRSWVSVGERKKAACELLSPSRPPAPSLSCGSSSSGCRAAPCHAMPRRTMAGKRLVLATPSFFAEAARHSCKFYESLGGQECSRRSGRSISGFEHQMAETVSLDGSGRLFRPPNRLSQIGYFKWRSVSWRTKPQERVFVASTGEGLQWGTGGRHGLDGLGGQAYGGGGRGARNTCVYVCVPQG